jgi:hypothetical protein
MDYEGFFKQRLDGLCAEGRYRVFADLERRAATGFRAESFSSGRNLTVKRASGPRCANRRKPPPFTGLRFSGQRQTVGRSSVYEPLQQLTNLHKKRLV